MSTGYLLDTSVLSMLVPGTVEEHGRFADWVRAHGDRLFISAITITEIEQGIGTLRQHGKVTRAEVLDRWLAALLEHGAGQIVAFDHAISQAAGRLSGNGLVIGSRPGFAEVGIAATALVRNLVLVTRNRRYFEPFGMTVVDPERVP
ncbi:MAG: PIN domain-containing protein [Acidobacteriaceae bacterium]|jgi:predicted nucleic acid-binding protein|nr:PIN domain-containing protein [Acidobacteriaceae bacterium]